MNPNSNVRKKYKTILPQYQTEGSQLQEDVRLLDSNDEDGRLKKVQKTTPTHRIL